MYSVSAAETWFMLSLICLSGAVAAFISLILNVIIKNSKIVLGQNRFVFICLLLSGVIAFGAVMINCTPWQNFFADVFFKNMYFYIILTIVTFLIVLFSHYVFVIVCIIYVLYAGTAWFIIHSEYMDSNAVIPVTVYNDAGSVTVSYIQFSSHLFLPFSRTWIKQIKSENVVTVAFKKSTIRGPFSILSKLIFSKTIKKEIKVPVSAAPLPPETWNLILKRQNGDIQYTFKRLL